MIRHSSDRLALGLLYLGVAAPILYYGLQAAVAPTFPGFSLVATTASELGSDLSPYAWAFNAGILALGAATLASSVGFWLALRRRGTPWALALVAALAVAANGLQSLWAGTFPMPDPRHGGHPAFIAAMLLLPFVLAAALWRHGRSWAPRVYFVATVLLLMAMVPLMSGLSGLDTQAYRGLLQRVFTLAVFPPIGVAAFVLARRLRASAGPPPARSPSLPKAP